MCRSDGVWLAKISKKNLFRWGIVGAGQQRSTINVTTPYEVLFCEKDSTWGKKPHFCFFFGVFLGFEH